MFLRALIIEVIIAISACPLNDMQHYTVNDLGNLLIFFRESSLWIKEDKSYSMTAFAHSDY